MTTKTQLCHICIFNELQTPLVKSESLSFKAKGQTRADGPDFAADDEFILRSSLETSVSDYEAHISSDWSVVTY